MYRQFGLIFLILLLLGCESTLEIKLEHKEPQIAVISLFTENEPWQVLVQRTVGVQENLTQSPRIENATVTIAGSDGSLVELTHRGGGFYYSDTSLPKPEIMYTLRVDAGGYGSVEANDQIPRQVKVENIKYIEARERTEITFSDEPGIKNYYAISFLTDYLQWSSFSVLSPELYDQMKRFSIQDPLATYIDQPEVSHALIHDKPFDGTRFTLSLSKSDHDKLTTYVRSISKNYYDYYLSKIVQKNAKGQAFSEPAPLRSNIRGGQGVFAGYSSHVEGDILPETIKDLVLGTYEQRRNSQSETIEFTLHPNYTVTGFMRYTKGSETINVSLDGGYSITNNESYDHSIQLHHTQESFFRNTALKVGVGFRYNEPDVTTSLSFSAFSHDSNGDPMDFGRFFSKKDAEE